MANALLPSDEQAGVPYQVHHLANELVALNHHVTVFSFSPIAPGGTYDVHRYPRLPFLRKFYPFLFAYHLATTDFSRFDVLHVHGDSFLLWKTHPQVRTFHGSAADEARTAKTLRRKAFFHVLNVLEKISIAIADQNVGVSEVTRRRFPRIRRVIPCGVDVNAFRPGSKTEHPTILFVGTLDGRKRGRLLAEVFARDVLPRMPNAELLMVSDLPIQGANVRNLGRVSDDTLAELYRSSWIFCLPSSYEGFGVPYIEAMASGTPVVASPNAGAREVLKDGAFGILCGDDKLGETLHDLLQNDTQRAELIRAGLVRAESFRWESVAAQYESVYEAAIGDVVVTGAEATMPAKSMVRGVEP